MSLLAPTQMIEADIGFVGEITRVNPTILNTLVRENYIPVVATIATDSESGQALNINADTAAGEVCTCFYICRCVRIDIWARVG